MLSHFTLYYVMLCRDAPGLFNSASRHSIFSSLLYTIRGGLGGDEGNQTKNNGFRGEMLQEATKTIAWTQKVKNIDLYTYTDEFN